MSDRSLKELHREIEKLLHRMETVAATAERLAILRELQKLLEEMYSKIK
jgi:16S rRNA C1402 (ribose-2'-O) methylase RsmI